ncbi:MAG: hypothetical protein ACTHJ3_03440 [Pararhizobium sp.]
MSVLKHASVAVALLLGTSLGAYAQSNDTTGTMSNGQSNTMNCKSTDANCKMPGATGSSKTMNSGNGGQSGSHTGTMGNNGQSGGMNGGATGSTGSGAGGTSGSGAGGSSGSGGQ